jgi:hypothetical protein
VNKPWKWQEAGKFGDDKNGRQVEYERQNGGEKSVNRIVSKIAQTAKIY